MEAKRELEVNLPKNFSIADAYKVDDYQKGLLTVELWIYSNENLMTMMPNSICSMRKAPDYHPSLDFSIIDENGEVASFANMWYDADNKIGILEPVGTIPKISKNGIGKGCNI